MSAFTKAIGGNDPATQALVANDVNRYMENAVGELGEKYAAGKGGMDTSETGPTGAAYKAAEAEKIAKAKKQAKAMRASLEDENSSRNSRLCDEDDEEAMDEDAELRNVRERRLRQIKLDQIEKLENLGKGHGQYREIVQDEFLGEVTSSKTVICHFYHDEFSRCKIMDHHLRRLAERHVESKFIKINAAKSPFFVEKLTVRSMPTLVFFMDGVASGKLIGFDGLSEMMPEGKEDEWSTVMLARMLGEANIINKELIVDEDEIEAQQKANFERIRREQYTAAMHSAMTLDDSDDDFSDVM